MVNLDDLTLGEVKQLLSFANVKNSDDSHWKLGKTYFIRTVTHHFVGDLVKVTDKELVLKECAWIADDGRFSDAVKKSEFSEVEPYGDEKEVIIGRGSIIDASLIDKKKQVQK